MGAHVAGIKAADEASAEALLNSLKSISPSERRRHASVFNYWLSIRGNHPFPPIRDFDPLEISEAGPCSLLLEMVGGGEDADIRHLGQAIKAGVEAAKISEAPGPSLLSCIAGKLPLVAATRQAFAFEDEFATDHGTTRCWVTLLPFSATGTWIDYVYGFVSLEPPTDCIEQAPEPATDEAVEQVPEPEAQDVEQAPEPATDEVAEQAAEPVAELDERAPEPETESAPKPEPVAANSLPSFSAKLIASLETVRGFYANHVEVEPSFSIPPIEKDEPKDVSSTAEGPLQTKLTQVRAKADEARMAKLRSNQALYEGLGAAYDFALDAEEQPEEYLRLVEAQGLKIQLRSPMAPVVKLAFDGLCDESTIVELEAVLAWALKQDMPRGSLAERIEAEGGLAPILNRVAKAA